MRMLFTFLAVCMLLLPDRDAIATPTPICSLPTNRAKQAMQDWREDCRNKIQQISGTFLTGQCECLVRLNANGKIDSVRFINNTVPTHSDHLAVKILRDLKFKRFPVAWHQPVLFKVTFTEKGVTCLDWAEIFEKPDAAKAKHN